MSRATRRIKLFDLYQRNLYYFAGPGKLFLCPICHREFTGESIQAGPSLEVDLAHCYPESCGGKLETLTCKKCNSETGRKYETHLTKELTLHEALHPERDGATGARLKFPTGNVGIEVSHDQSGMNMRVIAAQTDPAAIAALRAYMSSGTNLELNMEVKTFSQRKAAIALWHSAFLMMFREFGYEFALSYLGKKLRELLVAADSLDEHSFPCSFISSEAFDPRLLNRIGIVEAEDGFRCFYLLFPSPNPDERGRCVLLPGIANDAESEYEMLLQRRSGRRRFKYEQIGGTPEVRLRSRAYRGYLRCRWAGLPVETMLSVEAALAIRDLTSKNPSAPVALADVSKRAEISLELVQPLLRKLQTGLVQFNTTGDHVSLSKEGIEALNSVPWIESAAEL